MDENIQIVGNKVLTTGYQFTFGVNDNVITTWGSSWSGKEKIHINGKVVSEHYSYHRKSIHLFDIDGLPYEIEFNMVDILRGHLKCSLIEDGVHIETKSLAYKHPQVSGKELLKDFILWSLVGAAVGAVIGYLGAIFL